MECCICGLCLNLCAVKSISCPGEIMSSMLSLKSLFVAVSVFVALSCQAAEDEASLKFDMRANVSAAWKSQDMREIERLSQDFRTTRALAPSGAWKLSVLHTFCTHTLSKWSLTERIGMLS